MFGRTKKLFKILREPFDFTMAWFPRVIKICFALLNCYYYYGYIGEFVWKLKNEEDIMAWLANYKDLLDINVYVPLFGEDRAQLRKIIEEDEQSLYNQIAKEAALMYDEEEL